MNGGTHEYEIVQIGCTDGEFDLMKRAAEEDGQSVEEWFRDRLIEIASDQQHAVT